MKSPIYIFIFVAFFIFGDANAQHANFGKFSGKIVDNNNRLPISHVVISILGTEMSVQTDSLGEFVFDSLEVRVYSIIAQHPDYVSEIYTDVRIIQNKTTSREILLNSSIESSKSVDIKTFKFENSRSTPISTYNFSREEINLNPGSQGDIFRAIGMLPGVSSSGGIYSAISVRGQGVRDNVYMVDDIPLTEVGHLEGNSFFNDPNGGRFSIFAPRVIDHAQFQGGGFGADFGRRSASSLGLFIKEGNGKNAIIDGQVDLLGITLNYDGPIKFHKKTNIFLSARYQNFYGLVNLIGLKDIGLPIYGDLIFKSTTQLSQKHKLSFLAMICPESFVRDIDNVYADKKLNLLYLPNFKRNKVVLGLNLMSLMSKKSYIKHVLYYTSFTSDMIVGKAYPETDSAGNLMNREIFYRSNIQTQNYNENKWGIRSIYTKNFSNSSKLILGLEADLLELKNDRIFHQNDTNYVYRKTDVINQNEQYQVIYPSMVNATFRGWSKNVSGFANYSFIIGQKLSLNASLRYDFTGFSEQHSISPRLSGSYFFGEKSSINWGYGLYFQDPVYSDFADQPKGETLKMEKVTQYILGFRRNIRADLKFTIEIWYKDFQNMVTTPITGTVLKNNNGTGTGKGLDISLTKRLLKKFHGQLSYSWMETMRNDHDENGTYQFAFSQPHQFNLMLSYKASEKFTFSMRYRYATGKPKDNFLIHENVLAGSQSMRYSKEIIGKNELRLPDFNSLDLRANYHFKFKSSAITIFMDIVNVSNKQIPNNESFNYLTGQNYYDGLAIFPTGGMKFEF